MKLAVKNIGKVLDATINLNGLTVIAGSNGTGKSTLGRCLMTYVSVMRQLDTLVRYRKIDKFVEYLVSVVGLSDFSKHYIGMYFRYSEDMNLLSPEEWNTSDKVKRHILLAAKQYHESSFVKAKIDSVEIDHLAVQSRLNEINGEPFGLYVSSILEDCFRQAFNKQISPLANRSAIGSVSVFEEDKDRDDLAIRFESDKIVNTPKSLKFDYPLAIYIAPVHALDIGGNRRYFWGVVDPMERCGAGGLSLERILSNRNYDVRYQDDSERIDVELLAKDLIGIICGSLEESNEDLKFQEKFTDGESAFVELSNLASGTKTMAVVLHALRNGSLRRNQMLIIDEPESNLHPEWQIKFAHVLVMLYKRLSIRVILNTHSPYFLKAIEYYAEKENVQSSDSHYYLMKKEEGDVLYTVEECTGNTNRIFEMMYAPFTEIM